MTEPKDDPTALDAGDQPRALLDDPVYYAAYATGERLEWDRSANNGGDGYGDEPGVFDD